MSWDYAKDKRSDDQTRNDYQFGKANEKKVLDAIGYRYFLVNEADEFKKIRGYTVDKWRNYNNRAEFTTKKPL